MKLAKHRKKVGDVYGFELPNNKYAFARIFRDATIAIYEKLGYSIEDVPQEEKYLFYVGVYNDVIMRWKYIENRKFAFEDDSWPPAMCIVEAITGKRSKYYQGIITPSTYDECKDLEIAAVWEENQIIDRILGNNKWQNTFRK